MSEIKAGDKVYLKHKRKVITVIEAIEEELESPHNGDIYKSITKITAISDGEFCYLPIDYIMTKEEITYKVKSLEEELTKFKNTLIEMI